MSDAESKIDTLPALTELPEGFRLFREGKSIAVRHAGDGVFMPIDFPKRVWQENNYDLRYHVFTSESDRVTVPAVSAIDAMAQTGIKDPVRIVRGMASDETIAAVIQAGRLIPEESLDDEGPDATVAETDASPDSESEGPNAETDAEPQDVPEAETEAETQPEPEPATT